jgi:hypothetical protein
VGIGAAALIVLLSELVGFLILDAGTVVRQIQMLCSNLRSTLIRGKVTPPSFEDVGDQLDATTTVSNDQELTKQII